jgi:hypothetical protein
VKNTLIKNMNTELVAVVVNQVLGTIHTGLANSLIEKINDARADGKEDDEIEDVIRVFFKDIVDSVPKVSTPITPVVQQAAPRAVTPGMAAAAAAPVGGRPLSNGGASSSTTRNAKDKIPHPSGVGYIKCMGVKKSDNTPCAHDAKVQVMEGGVAKYYCGVHGKAGSGAQPKASA